jgi:replicative superfamily II helicase
MRKNPMVYGLTISDVEDDPLLGSKRHSLIEIAAKKLHQIGMISFDQMTGSLDPTELGRIASKYYIKHSTIEIFNQLFRPKMTEADVSASCLTFNPSDVFVRLIPADNSSFLCQSRC